MISLAENTRIIMQFQVLEVGHHPLRYGPCFVEYINIAVDDAIVTLCGSHNATGATSIQYISQSNTMTVQLVSRDGKQGRGFNASYRFGMFIFFSFRFFHLIYALQLDGITYRWNVMNNAAKQKRRS